ncbi:MAG TPA: heme exporter protein CcmD [Alphaproteobacteria bacterium]|nr:heme exporter protein CcmD [Alphaproteobacteria bacterium]
MSNFSTFLSMGGYGAYVWPAYGLTAVAFIAAAIWTIGTLRARRREEEALSAVGRQRRKARS